MSSDQSTFNSQTRSTRSSTIPVCSLSEFSDGVDEKNISPAAVASTAADSDDENFLELELSQSDRRRSQRLLESNYLNENSVDEKFSSNRRTSTRQKKKIDYSEDQYFNNIMKNRGETKSHQSNQDQEEFSEVDEFNLALELDENSPKEKSQRRPKPKPEPQPQLKLEFEIEKILGERVKKIKNQSEEKNPEKLTETPAVEEEKSKAENSSDSTELCTEYLIKWRGRSYLHCSWLSSEILVQIQTGRRALTKWTKKIENFEFENFAGDGDAEPENENEGETKKYFNPDYLLVDRILAHEVSTDGREEFLVKWVGLGYDETSWEILSDIQNFESEIARYFELSKKIPSNSAKPRRANRGNIPKVESIKFKENRELRSYQIEGAQWLAFNFSKNRNSLLADEMVNIIEFKSTKLNQFF